MTANADTTKSGARIQKKKTSACIVRLFVIVPLPDCRSLCGKRAELSQRERRIPCRHGAAASSRAPNTPVDKAHRATGRGRLSLLLRRETALSIRRVHRDVARQLPLPSIAVVQQSLLVVIKLFARLGREFEVRPLDDRVDRAGLLAHPAVDALDHVDVVARGAARAVIAPRSRLDRNRLSRANRLAQLAGDASLLAIRIAAKRMLSTEAGAKRRLLMRIVERRPGLEHVADRQPERGEELCQEQRLGRMSEPESHYLPLLSVQRARGTRPKTGEFEHSGHHHHHL